MSELKEIIGKLKALMERKEILEKRREEILEEISKLMPIKGYIERKWVKNKIGKKYYYYYYRYYDNGHLKSEYLGDIKPPELLKGIEDKRKYMILMRELKAINKELDEIENRIEIIRRALS